MQHDGEYAAGYFHARGRKPSVEVALSAPQTFPEKRDQFMKL